MSLFLSRALAHTGGEIETVPDGEIALQRLESGRVDVFVTDWMLPKIDGIDVVRRMRKQFPHRPRVVVLSGLSQPEARAHALGAGADEYLCKPAALDVLQNAVRRVMTPGAPIVPVVAAVPGVSGLAAERLLTSQPLWTGFASDVASQLNAITRLDLRPSAGAITGVDAKCVASLGMLDVDAQLELHYFLRCTMAAGAVIAKAMLPRSVDHADVVTDMLAELCSLLLGSAKKALRGVGFQFTLGVPRGSVMPIGFSMQSRVVLGGPAARIIAGIGLRSAKVASIQASALRENMILIDDARSESGVVLAPAGSRLTSTRADLLSRELTGHHIRVSFVGS